MNIFQISSNLISPILEKDIHVLHLTKNEYSSPNDVLCQIWLKLNQLFWIKRFYRYLFLEKVMPFIWMNRIPSIFIPFMLCAKFCWDWASSGEENKNCYNEDYTDRQTADNNWSEKPSVQKSYKGLDWNWSPFSEQIYSLYQ